MPSARAPSTSFFSALTRPDTSFLAASAASSSPIAANALAMSLSACACLFLAEWHVATFRGKQVTRKKIYGVCRMSAIAGPIFGGFPGSDMHRAAWATLQNSGV